MIDVKFYYNRKAESYDDMFEMFYFKVYDFITWKFIEPYLPKHPDSLVLDAGGGTGRWAIRMAEAGCRVVLMDISQRMLNVAATKVTDMGLQDKIIIREADISKTGYPDETFDMILCEHTLFLFEDPNIPIKELKRVLKRKAPLIVSVPNRYVQSLACLPEKPDIEQVDSALKILVREKYNTIEEKGRVKIYTWTPHEFRAMLEANGFCVEKIIGKVVTMPLRISKEPLEAGNSREFGHILENHCLFFFT